MMTPQQLRSSILQLAIQGRLVEQRPEEGTGAELLREISTQRRRDAEAAKKESRAKSAKSAKESRLASNVSRPVEDAPFEIPESWVWVRLEDLVIKEIKRGKSPVYTQQSGTLVFAQKCNTKAGHIDLSLALFLDESKLSKYPKSEFMVDKDIVINSTGNGTLGRVGLYRSCDNPNKLPVVPDSHVTVIRVGENVSIGYVFYGLKHYQPLLEKLCSGSTNQTELSATTVKSLLFPLPPLAEQKRIVAKIEELLPLIDRYEKAWSRLEDFNKRFPVDMQKSLLQLAIQGKLVEQRPEEGTAAELLEKIFAAKNAKDAKKESRATSAKSAKESRLASNVSRPVEDAPFDIPESWEWVRFPSVVDIATNLVRPTGYENDRHIAPDNIEKGTGKLLECRTVAEDKVVSSNHLFFKGQVIYSKIRPLLRKVVIAPFDGLCSADMYPLNTQIESHFLLFYMLSDAFNIQIAKAMSSRVKMPKINRVELTKVLIPLPPLAEQKRIVAKLEELLPLCERLK